MAFNKRRGNLKLLLLLATLCILILTLRSTLHDEKYSIGCETSQECLDLLKEKAKKFGEDSVGYLLLADEDKKAMLQEDEQIRSMYNIQQHQEQEVEDEEINIISYDDLEYSRLTSMNRVKAAFVVLVRNSELYQLRSSMSYLEKRFNHRFNYPWIFLNEEPFTDEFKNLTASMTNAEVHYGLIPEEHWSYPDWIDQDYAAATRRQMQKEKIVYGGSESYRHMCRYQSGFFMLHPLLDDLDYYWRVEPGVKFSCDMEYDPFRLMQERDLKYGFTISLQEYRATIPTLWDTTIQFAREYPQYIYPRTKPDSLLEFVSDDKGWNYNLCHFWSNFEIASVKFMRSEAYQAYFNYLDRAGGFFYERWGDAPVHSIAVALMLKREEVHWFYDIGYKHDFFEHCPIQEDWLVHGKCYCEPTTSFVHNQGSCHNQFLKAMNRTASSFIVTRPDPQDLL